MAGLAHDVLIQALRDDPQLLSALLGKLTGRAAPGMLKNVDSAVRFTRSLEVRPDVVYRAGRSWLLCEVQNRPDDTKARSWLMAMAALRFTHRRMGDLVVITTSRSVARWAATVAHERGRVGTTSHLTPVVLLLDRRSAHELLDPARPELALCAAWSMQKRHGADALRIVGRAVELSDHLPEPLRDAQRRAILSVLSDRLRSRFQETIMHPDRVPESPKARAFRLWLDAHFRAEGRRESLELVLMERGIPLSVAQCARIKECSDIPQLDIWLRRAVTAATVDEVLGPAPEKTPTADPATTPAPGRRPAARRAKRGVKNGTHA